jgi:hypothetical protein
LPCSHHLKTIGRLVATNSVVHPEGQGGKLLIPLDGQVGRDHNQNCVHEAKTSHLSIEGKKELG